MMSAPNDTFQLREILAALRSGTVPERGIESLAVGVEDVAVRLETQLEDIGRGSADYRFIIGDYGAGKSFLCSLLRERALRNGFIASTAVITADTQIADMAMLYRRIVDGLRTSERRSGSALQDVVERWLMGLYERSAQLEGVGLRNRDKRNEISAMVERQIESSLQELGDSDVGFARALAAFCRGRLQRDPALARDALQWLRGSNHLPVEARRRLGVKGEITRESALGALKGLLRLVRLAGFKGGLIVFDEAEVILRLPTKGQRDAAFDTLRLLVDACGENEFQGALFVVTGTPNFMSSKDLGVASHAPLAQRLERPTASNAPESARSPVITLHGLDGQRLAEAARAVRELHGRAFGHDVKARMPDELIDELARQATTAFGEESRKVPRKFLKEIVYLCDLCEEYPSFDAHSFVLGSATSAVGAAGE